jgi:hypothetical protein
MHFLHSFIHEGQFVQLVGATFGHNYLCIFAQEFFIKKKNPLSKGHYKLKRSKSAYDDSL